MKTSSTLVFPLPFCHIAFNFTRGFIENYVLVEILSRDVFGLIFIKELHDAVSMYDFLDSLPSQSQD